MNRAFVPQVVLDAAHARSTARQERRWDDADRLRAEIEAAGWRVIDSGVNFRLELAGLPDVIDGEGIRYGTSSAVPSRAEEPASRRATIVIVAGDPAEPAGRSLEAVLATPQVDDQVVVVIDGPDPVADMLANRFAGQCEFVQTASRLGAGAALNIALRRATGRVVVVLGPGTAPTGDVIRPLVEALDDPTVAVTGLVGYRTRDLRQVADVTTRGDATAISGDVLAFRRSDGLAALPVDEAFVSRQYLDTWWSLTLRARTQADGSGGPGRALVLGDLPVRRASAEDATVAVGPDAARLGKRNFYRLLNAFRDRDDLLAEPVDG